MGSQESALTVREVPADAAWDRTLAAFPDHTVFHTSGWLRTIAAAHGVTPACAVAERDGTCLGAWPVLLLRKGPLRVLGSPLPGWSTAYMGPVFAPGSDLAATTRAFLAHRLFRRYAYFAVRTQSLRAPLDLEPFGFTRLLRFETYLLDLASRDEEALWCNLKSECRTRIRKAEKLGIEVRRESDPAFLDDFWRMSEETFLRSRIQPTHTRAFCHELWRALPRNLITLSAFVDGRRAATLMLPHDAHTLYYWAGVGYQEFRDLPVQNALHWQAIKDAKTLGLSAYDFISSSGGPGRFKKTFGPDPVVSCEQWERTPSRLMQALRNRAEAWLRKRRRVQTEE